MAPIRQRAPDAVRCYRFGDLVVDMQQRRLFAGGRERRLSRRAFDLLAVLCRSPRRVIARDELHEALWPGGQVVSDEALTQAVFRLRAVLGPEAERIVTLRGIGIRFDADVERESEAPAAARADAAAQGGSPASDPQRPRTVAAAPPHAAVARRRRRRRTFALAFVLVALAGAGWAGLRWFDARAAFVDEGYAMRTRDLHAERPESPHLLAEAIRHDNEGDRPRARALLEALHDSDARTPWPALLLGLWSVGAGDPAAAERWLARARERIAPVRDVYLNAMLRYAEAEQAGSAEDIVRHAGAVLDLRPEAWRMRLARAHLRYHQGLREGALAEISRIEVRALGDRKLESVLADRASYGDVEGAMAMLERLPRASDAAAWHYLAGRLAWSRGDGRAALRAWLLAAAEAKKNGRSGIGTRARGDAGVAAMFAGDTQAAIAHLETARVGMAEAGWVKDEVDVTLVLAQLHALEGNPATARAEFARALAACRRGSGGELMRTHAALVGTRLFPDAATGFAPPQDAAAAALLSARHALLAGDRQTARDALRAAEQRGALERSTADEARLLAAELGLPVAPERAFDPPYAPRSGAAARLFLPASSAPTR